MELILISESKLKIMLSQKDMSKYALKLEEINYDNTETRRAFWSILDEAKHKTGFDAAREKVYIQVFPSRAGGCEIFVTRLDLCEDSETISLEVKNSRSSFEIFTFGEINDLLCVCSLLNRCGYESESSVYTDDKYYYLLLSDLSCTVRGISKYAFIDDYAIRRENKKYIYHILEHCKGVCIGEAVPTLAPLR